MQNVYSGATGSIPENYDRGLGPVFFNEFAAVLAGGLPPPSLEIAAGTGIVGRRLRDLLPAIVELTVTDLTHEAKYAWRLWSLTWPAPTPGEHAITSRAIGADDSTQPAPADPPIAGKHSFWESNGQITRHIRLS